jgi:hypothetical protein
MKQRIRLLTVLLFSIIGLNSFGQVFLAGQNLSHYVDIIPDTLIDYSCVTHYSTESYQIDLNGDSQNDFEIKGVCSVSPGSSSQFISISTLNVESYIRAGRIDSSYNTYMAWWMTAPMAQPLQYNDSINSINSKWGTNLYLSKSYSITGSYLYAHDWDSPNDQYIGVKIQNATDTIYGWIRVNCYAGCNLKDFSASSSIIGIETFEFQEPVIYPNPCTDKIYFEGKDQSKTELSLYDLCGKQVAESIINKGELSQINISALSNGIYILKVQGENYVKNKKIIIQH